MLLVAEDVAECEGCVVGRENASRHLVEKRLELLVVVLVDEGDVDVVVWGEFEGAAQAGEASADDDDTP